MELFGMNLTCLELLGLAQNGSELFGTNGVELIRMQNEAEWFRMLQDGSEWRSMG